VKPDRVALLHERVRTFLEELKHPFEETGETFVLVYGSTRVLVRPQRWTRDHSILKVRAHVLNDVELDGNEHMFEEFNNMNDRFLFGTIFWTPKADGVGDIVIEHNLIGETLDSKEFSTALLALALTADDLDDNLQDHLGGRRAVDPRD